MAPGSVNEFLTGKHFNRSKGMHPMLSAALQNIHFEAFLELSHYSWLDVKVLLDKIREDVTPEDVTW